MMENDEQDDQRPSTTTAISVGMVVEGETTIQNLKMDVGPSSVGLLGSQINLLRPSKKLNPSSFMFDVSEPIQPFYGREAFLHDLHTKLQGQNHLTVMEKDRQPTILSRIKVITGLGGVGKSETVQKYVSMNEVHYHRVIWINAENELTMTQSFVRLAKQRMPWLLPPEAENKAENFVFQILQQMYETLCTQLTLFIFDNAEQYLDRRNSNDLDGKLEVKNGIFPFLPQALPPHMTYPLFLVTSRNQDWGSAFDMIHLDVFTEAESVHFIQQELALDEQDEENEADATDMAALLGGLPLAGHQAVAYIRKARKESKFSKNGGLPYTLRHYINSFLGEFERQSQLQYPPQSHAMANETVATVWNSTFAKIEGRGHPIGKTALEILELFSLFPGVTMAIDFLYLHFPASQVEGGHETVQKSLVLLEKYGVIKHLIIDGSIHYIRIHRLLQAAVMETLRQRMKAGKSPVDPRRPLTHLLKSDPDTVDVKVDDCMTQDQKHFTQFMNKLGLDDLDGKPPDDLTALKGLVEKYVPNVFGQLKDIIEPQTGIQADTCMAVGLDNFLGYLGSLQKDLQGSGPTELLKELGPMGRISQSRGEPVMTTKVTDTESESSDVQTDEKSSLKPTGIQSWPTFIINDIDAGALLQQIETELDFLCKNTLNDIKLALHLKRALLVGDATFVKIV